MASIQRIGSSWRALVRRRGHKSICRTFRTKAEAQDWAIKSEAQLGFGKPVVSLSGLRIDQLIQTYRELREQSRPIEDTSNEHYMLKHLEEHLGHCTAESLTPQHLVRFCKARAAAGAGAYTGNMEISKLGTVWRYASVALRVTLPDVIGQARPLLSHLRMIGGGGKRERRPSEDELARLLELLAQPYADAVRLAVLSAMRRGEIVRLKWEDIDADKRLILVRDRKDPRRTRGNDQWLPLLGEAWDIIQRQPRASPRIFPIHEQTLSKYFKRACDTLGIADLHFHDLRHEGVSRLFEKGLSIEQVSLVSGHRDWRHLKRYTNLRPESLHDHGNGPGE